MRFGKHEECIVREELEKRFGVKFEKKKLSVHYRESCADDYRTLEFDFVSADGRIVGQCKSSPLISRGAQFAEALFDCRKLESLNAEKKLMIFTNEHSFERFKKKSEGLISRDIDILYIPVPQQ